MANTSSRTLRLLSLLQTHRFWPGGELAGRLGVSDRTLRRDIERLRDLGYPVHSSRGLEGGYQLAPGGSMPPLVVDEAEAIAMVAALGTAATTYSGTLSEASLSALAKVVQVLPARLRRRAEALRAATVDSPFSRAPEVEAGVLATVAQAIRDSERLRFGYTARGGSKPGEDLRRHVEPHRLVTVGRRWYLLGYDLDRHDWRSFRLDRLREPSGTKAVFRPREVPGGDAAAFVREGIHQRDQEIRFTVAVTATEQHVRQRIGSWAQVTGVDGDEVTVEFIGHDPRWAVFGVGYLEAPVRLLDAPPEVRDKLAEWAGRLAATAGRGTGSGG